MSIAPPRRIGTRALLCGLIAATSPAPGCDGVHPEPANSGAPFEHPQKGIAQDSKPSPIARTLAQAPFQARRERKLEAKPSGLCAADFDGDGNDDLALTTLLPGGAIVWRGSPDGLARESESRTCGDYPLAPLALPRGHFGAGAKERRLALVSRATRALEIVPAFQSAPAAKLRASIVLEHAPRAMATAVVQERAWIAIACDDQRLEVLREGSAACEHWSFSGEFPRCALISEELGAVLVGFQDSMEIEACLPAGAAPLGRLRLGGIPRDMATLDIDGDGDLELVVAGGDHELWMFGLGVKGGARSWFEPGAASIWNSGAIPLQLCVADFDGDHRSDLAVLHHYDLSARLLCKLSAAGPGSSSSLYVGQTAVGFAALDGDGDGHLDLAVANRDTFGLGLLPGDGAGALDAGASIALGSFPNALAAAPESAYKDCALRLVALNSQSTDASAVVQDGKALRALAGVPTGSQPRAPIVAEIDGTPGLDLLLLSTNPRGAQLELLRGDPAGRLTPTRTLEIGGAASDLALIDVDRDGKAELAICDPISAIVMLCESAAARCEPDGLARAARLRIPSTPWALRPIELDGDPESELACVLGAPGDRLGVAWLDARRKPSGELELVELGFSALPGAPIDAVACDLNADGRMDLALLALDAPNSTAGKWYALLRGPKGPTDFWISPPIPTGLRPHRIAARDLDGDGRAEVFVAAQDSHLVNAWTPEVPSGANSFSVKVWEDLGAGRGPLDLCLCDVDGDGHVDLCVVNGFSKDVTVLHGREGVKAK